MPVARFDTYRTVNFSAITPAFTAIGAAIQHNWRIFRIVNNTNGDLIVSEDGVNNNIFVPANSFVLYDLSTNSDINLSNSIVLKLGAQFYVKSSTVPTSGDLYIEGMYQQGS